MGNRFDYKNIYFSFLLNGVFGQTKELHDYNFDRWMPTYNYISGMDYWTPENPTNEMTSPAYVPYDKHSFYKKMNYVNNQEHHDRIHVPEDNIKCNWNQLAEYQCKCQQPLYFQ